MKEELIHLGNLTTVALLEEDVNEAMSTLLSNASRFLAPEDIEAIAQPLIMLHMLLNSTVK